MTTLEEDLLNLLDAYHELVQNVNFRDAAGLPTKDHSLIVNYNQQDKPFIPLSDLEMSNFEAFALNLWDNGKLLEKPTFTKEFYSGVHAAIMWIRNNENSLRARARSGSGSGS